MLGSSTVLGLVMILGLGVQVILACPPCTKEDLAACVPREEAPDCEPATTECGCCKDNCALKLAETCSYGGLPCKAGLKCIYIPPGSKRGRLEPPWVGAQGKCRPPIREEESEKVIHLPEFDGLRFGGQ